MLLMVASFGTTMEVANSAKKVEEASKITGEALRRSGDRNEEHQKKEKS